MFRVFRLVSVRGGAALPTKPPVARGVALAPPRAHPGVLKVLIEGLGPLKNVLKSCLMDFNGF